ncbi:MAG TPA: hypothetical protein VD866_01665, partial [Urbifossiella sp.]|nr:hypothetical protein [Urbifossiella sp.]
RPQLGQWAYDVTRLLDLFKQRSDDGELPGEIVVVGEGSAGLAALAAGAADPRITKVAAVGSLASWVADEPYAAQWLGTFAPGIVRDVGDVAHLAALAAPRRVVIGGGVGPSGAPLTTEQVRAVYERTRSIWVGHGAADALRVVDADPAKVAEALR